MRPIIRSLVVFGFALGACGGDGSATYKINFKALVAGAPFSCSSTYDNIGSSKTTIQPLDFRMYVQDVSLVRAGGAHVPLALTPDPIWQSKSVALLDFEDGTGLCNTASPDTRTFVTGTAPSQSDYTGVQFTLGVPPDLDHLDVASATAPQNVPALWWSWLGGYRFVRIDVASQANESWSFHLGAMNCTGAVMTDINCKYPNQSTITLGGFTPSSSVVTMDLATLFADSDLDAQVDGMTDLVPGCMSGPDDPECPALYSKVGLTFQSNDAGPAQTFFTVSE